MPDGCDCGEGEFVAALDLKLVPSHVPGNKYCRMCKNCGKRHFVSRKFFERSEDKHVIPVKETDPVEATECDSCDSITWVTGGSECARCGENIFDCPNCGEEVQGEPDECPNCGTDYNW